MDKKKTIGLTGALLPGILLIVFAAYILIGVYADVLYTVHEHSVFTEDSMFFCATVSRPFGLMQYIGCFLTQFLYYPALGATILIAIWLLSCLLSIKVFHLEGIWRALAIIPVACLAASVVDLGYWIYTPTIPGYFFSQSVGYLCILFLMWGALATPRRYRLAWYIAVGFLGFHFFGWMSYLYSLCLAICMTSQVKKDEKRSKVWMDVAGIALTVNAPLILRPFLYKDLLIDIVFRAGFPTFKTTTDEITHLSIPFFIFAISLLILSFGSKLPKIWADKTLRIIAVRLTIAIGCAWGVWTAMFKDDNYIYEMQMSRAAMNDDWQSVIQVAEKTRQPSRTMVMLKNIALLNTGELGERSFELGNSGVEINNPDSLNISTMHIASPLIYYNYGAINYSMRWCMEFSVPYGFSPYYLKMLARCAEVSGEKKLAKRYTDRLHRSLFYRDWQPAPASAIVKELYTIVPDFLDADDNNCERYIIKTFSKAYNKKSKLLTELSLFYSIILRDASVFCPVFYNYAKDYDGDRLPTAYEEAYCLFIERFPERFPYRAQISPATQERYSRFMQAGSDYAQYAPTEEAVGEQMFDIWGGTYWWFNAFGRSTY